MTIFTAVSIPLVLAVSIVLAIETEFSPPVSNTKVLPTWEDEILNGYLPYHQLTADDFPVKDNLAPEAAYRVQPFAHYYYNCISKMAHGGMIYAYVKDWTVFSGFNKNLSGRKAKFRVTKDELAYAQAFLDINELYARRLGAMQPGEFPSGSGRTWAEAQRQLENRIETLCQIQMTEIRKEGETLEKATKQGQNKKRVRELVEVIKKRLAQLPPATGPSPTATPISGNPPIFIPPPATLTPPH